MNTLKNLNGGDEKMGQDWKEIFKRATTKKQGNPLHWTGKTTNPGLNKIIQGGNGWTLEKQNQGPGKGKKRKRKTIKGGEVQHTYKEINECQLKTSRKKKKKHLQRRDINGKPRGGGP